MALMKLNPRRIAPFGLYLALLAVIVSIGLYIVQQQFDLALKGSVWGIDYHRFGHLRHFRSAASFAKLDGAGAPLWQQYLDNVTGNCRNYPLIVVNFFGVSSTGPCRLELPIRLEPFLPETLDALKKLPQPVTALALMMSHHLLRLKHC